MATSAFRATCLSVLEEVAATVEPVLVIERGVSVAQVVAATPERKRLFEAMKGSIHVTGVVVAPTHVEWGGSPS